MAKWSSQLWVLLKRDSNRHICDASALLYKLSYQAHWELVVMRFYDKPLDKG